MQQHSDVLDEVTEQGTLIEEVIATKIGLGAEYKLQPDTIEIKKNVNGVMGMFARRDMKAGSDVVSVPVQGGSMTPLRAYEEARGLLSQLGVDRFNVHPHFILTCAIYQRFMNSDTNETDILTIGHQHKDEAHGIPFASFSNRDNARLMDDNNKLVLQEAEKIDRWIEALDVDQDMFRKAYAYCKSRSWEEHGLIPVLDMMNASYGNNTNVKFVRVDEQYKYVLSRDVKAGDELTWNYNSCGRQDTWIHYGYVDPHRPCSASLMLAMSKTKKDRFTRFARETMGNADSDITPASMIDGHKYQFKLSVPGTPPSLEVVRRDILSSISGFRSVRYWMRAIALSEAREPWATLVTPENLHADDLKFGKDVEISALDDMHLALERGYAHKVSICEDLDSAAPDCSEASCNMSIYTSMLRDATLEWQNILSLLKRILKSENLTVATSAVSEAFDLDSDENDDVLSRLDQLDAVAPRLSVSMARIYLKAIQH